VKKEVLFLIALAAAQTIRTGNTGTGGDVMGKGIQGKGTTGKYAPEILWIN
jgi:hypothetical protein